MSDSEHAAQIRAFLKREVPGNPAKFASWKRVAVSFRGTAPAVCLRVLETGKPELHYSALLTLRALGYQAAGHGHGSKTYYTVKPPFAANPRIIHPKHSPPDMPSYLLELATPRRSKSPIRNRSNAVAR